MILKDEMLVNRPAAMGKTEEILLGPAIRCVTIGPQPPAAAPPIKFWNVASVSEDEAEITLYGEICDSQPTDWWTGEPIPGNFITPEGFMEDLETVRGKGRITIRLNSVGGDLYTSIAIHNALKDLAGHKTVIVEGIAASGGSVIMCAGDTTEAYPGSMVMIHGVSGLLYDFYNIPELRQVIKGFDAGERAIAEIYSAKTGLEVETLRSMMTKETWMTGKEALDKGFVDSMREGPTPLMSISADKTVLMVNGIRHSLKGFQNIPDSIPISKTAPPAAAARPAAKIQTPPPQTEGGKQQMTLEELMQKHPELVNQIETGALAKGSATAIETERARIQGIEEIEAVIGDPELIREAKYGEKPLNAAELALAAAQRQAKLGAQHLNSAAADFQSSGAAGVGALAPPAAEDSTEADMAQLAGIASLYNNAKTGGTKNV